MLLTKFTAFLYTVLVLFPCYVVFGEDQRPSQLWDKWNTFHRCISVVVFATVQSTDAFNYTTQSLRRVKRQGLFCAGSAFVHQVLTTIFDRNRETLRQNEPNKVGKCQYFGLFTICNFRAWGLSRAIFPESLQATCDKEFIWAKFDVVVGLPNVEVNADVTFPLSLAGCTLKGEARLLGARCIAYWPINKGGSGLTPKVDEVDILAYDGLKFSILGGSYPLGPVLRMTFSLLLALTPYVVQRLFANILKEAFQQWIDGYHDELPF